MGGTRTTPMDSFVWGPIVSCLIVNAVTATDLLEKASL